jgi:hypothetical protein
VAIRDFAGLLVVVLVIVLCRPKLACRDYLGFDIIALLFELLDQLLGYMFLLFIQVKKCRSVL